MIHLALLIVSLCVIARALYFLLGAITLGVCWIMGKLDLGQQD